MKTQRICENTKNLKSSNRIIYVYLCAVEKRKESTRSKHSLWHITNSKLCDNRISKFPYISPFIPATLYVCTSILKKRAQSDQREAFQYQLKNVSESNISWIIKIYQETSLSRNFQNIIRISYILQDVLKIFKRLCIHHLIFFLNCCDICMLLSVYDIK